LIYTEKFLENPAENIFTRCPGCGFSWPTREEFLADPEIELIEYRTNLRILRLGVFCFFHDQPICKNEIEVEATLFSDLGEGAVFSERETGSKKCRGYCLDPKRVEIDQAICECEAITDIAAIIREWPKSTKLNYNLLVEKCRTFRRFDESKPIARKDLLDLVNLARLSPSRANQQPLKYFISSEPGLNAKIFPTLSWASYFRGWDGPAEGERPAGYIVVLHDDSITRNATCEDGIAAQTMKLGATYKGLGGCIINAVDHEALRKVISLKDCYQIRLVLALGVPAEKVKLESADGSIRYWRDKEDVIHTPKRPLDEIIIKPRKKQL
jgi:nitroreductase